MANKKFLYTCLLILATTLVILSGCASSSGSTSSGGLQAGPGVDVNAKTITLGILSPYSGPVAAPIGIPLANGVKVFFDHVNDNGGVDGFKVKFLEEDTKYDPQTEVQLYNQIHNQVLMIADSLGTPTTFAVKDLADKDHMLVSAATLSSALAREKYLILAGTPYRLQTENAFDYVVNKLGDKTPKVGIIYQDDDYGQDGLTGYNEAVNYYHLQDVGKLPFAVTATDFTSQVAQMKAAGAKYVFLTTLPTAAATIIGTGHALGYNPQWILQSPAFSTLLLASPVAPLLDKHVWVVSQGATWGDTSVPGMAEMMSAIQKYMPNQKPDGFFEFGYTISKVTAAIIKKALDNNDVSRAGLVNAYDNLGDVDVGGLIPTLHYGTGASTRVPSRDSVVYLIDSSQPGDVKSLSGDFVGAAAAVSQF